MWPERLSPHFTFEELTRSAAAERLGIDNTPPEALQDNAWRLCELAEQARAVLAAAAGREIKMIPSNGFRCLAVNTAVGGSGARAGEKLSAHCDFRAMDFQVLGTNLATAFDVLRRSSLQFDKLIFEIDARGVTWLHLQVAREGERPALRVLRGVKGPDGSSYRDLPHA